MAGTPYLSALAAEQRSLVEPLIPDAEPGGRPHSIGMREVLNGIFYLSRAGCSWRQRG